MFRSPCGSALSRWLGAGRMCSRGGQVLPLTWARPARGALEAPHHPDTVATSFAIKNWGLTNPNERATMSKQGWCRPFGGLSVRQSKTLGEKIVRKGDLFLHVRQFFVFDSPKTVKSLPENTSYLKIEHYTSHPGGYPPCYPAQRNKSCLFCCVQSLAKNIRGGSPLNSTKYCLLLRWAFWPSSSLSD